MPAMRVAFSQLLFCIFCLILIHPIKVNGGYSKLAEPIVKKGNKEISQKIAKQSLRDSAEKITYKKLSKVFSDQEIVRLNYIVEKLSKQTGIDSEELVYKLLKNRTTVARLISDGNEPAIEMALRNGDGGWFLLDRFPGRFKRESVWLKETSDNAIQEAWKLVDPMSASGSWVRLRNALTKAGINGPDRDFAEDLFLNRLKAGRIFGFPKDAEYWDGHVGDIRQGFDFMGIHNGKPIIIEFSTGKKPSPTNPLQMSDDYVKKTWLKIISDPDQRINLRDKGIPAKLLDQRTISDENFNVTEHFDKFFAAPDFNLTQARELGCKTVRLP